MKRLALLAVAVVLLLAGCSGLPIGGDSAPEPPSNVTYPMGASPIQFTDPGAVADGPTNELADTSYTMTAELTIRGETQRYVVRHAANQTHGRAVVHGNIHQSWSQVDGGEVVTLTDSGDVRASLHSHHYRNNQSSFKGAVTERVIRSSRTVTAQMIRIGDYRAVGTVQRGGEELIKYRATDGNITVTESAFAGQGANYDSMEYDGTVLLSQDGYVQQMNVTVRVNNARTISYNYSVTDVGGTTVDKPSLSEVTEVQGHTVGEGARAVALTHVGGPNYTDTVQIELGRYDPYTVNATLDEPFTEGDTIYIYLTDEKTELQPHVVRSKREVPRRVYRFREFHMVDFNAYRSDTDGFSVEFHFYDSH